MNTFVDLNVSAVTLPPTTTFESTVIPVITFEKFTVFAVSIVELETPVKLDPSPI